METNKIQKELSLEQLYHCPMNCESDKTYKETGKCPVCNMNLVSENEHNHEHHHNHGQEHQKTETTNTGAKHYCPMLCEGDKTYDELGDCPECGMHLKSSESVKQVNLNYTCPMHPEINLPEPGDCPKCGMSLIPVTPTNDNHEEREYKAMLKKFWIAVIFTLPVFLIAMLDMVKGVGLEELFPIRTWNWIQMFLTIPVVFYAGGTF
ncbi:MAG: ATPase, partial [Bacteroidetes bacterium]